MKASDEPDPSDVDVGAARSAAPRVTVIIATYNWSSVLPYSVGSALDQTFRDIEVLVVGDGCTDDSERVVGAIDDPRLRWINLPRNTGHQSGPNNEGLRQARGELIAYLGHDDLWLPHHLALLVDALAGGTDLAYGITALVRPEGNTEVHAAGVAYRPGAAIVPSSVLHRRAVTDAVGRVMELHAGDARPAFVVIPIGVWHGLQNLAGSDALMLNCPSRAYDYEDPDHWRLPYDSPEIPYSWSARESTRLRSDATRWQKA